MTKKSNSITKFIPPALLALLLFGMMAGMASAAVSQFTITPTDDTAGKVSAYNVTVNTTFNSLNVSIPAGFGVEVPTGGALIARADLWWGVGYFGNVTFRANATYPSNKMDVYANISTETATYTQDVNYNEGAITPILSRFGNKRAELKLPTTTSPGYMNISLPAGLTLTNATIEIGSLVKNPTKAGNYTFIADSTEANVTIKPDVDVKLAVYPDTPKTANGIDEATIKVYAQDQYGNNVTTPANIQAGGMTPSKDKLSAVLSLVTGSGNASSPFTFTVKDTVAEDVTITAVDTGNTGTVLTSGNGVQKFIAAAGSVNLTSSKPSIVANYSDTAVVTAQLKDSGGKNVEKVTTITWSVDNTTLANVTATSGSNTWANGSATATIKGASGNLLGTVEVRAIAEGILGKTNINLVVGPPNNTKSTVNAYNATWAAITNATVGAEVTISATLKDEIAAHPPLSGESVTFSIVSSPGDGASLSTATVVSDAKGHANTTLTLSTKAGKNEVRVKSASGDVNKTVSVWGDAASVTLRSPVDNATVGSNVTISARLLDPINGTAINGTNVNFSVVSPGNEAVVSPGVVSTVNGYANTTLTLSTKTGNNTIRAISTRYDVNTTVNVTGIAGNATRLNLTTDKLSLPTAANATLTARLLDLYGNPTTLNATGGIASVNVSFTQDTTEYGNLSAPYNSTVGGVTTVNFTASVKSGTTTITGSAVGLVPDSVTIFTGVPVSVRLTASPTNILMNQTTQNSTITAQLLDQYGTVISVSDWKITFTASVPGNVTLTNSTGVTAHPVAGYTDANGTAWINLTSKASVIEKITVTAMPSGLPTKQVEVQIRGDVAKIVLSADPRTGVVADGTAKSVITAQLKDARDNYVAEAGREVTFSASAGVLSAYSVNTDSSGAASVNLTSKTAGDITVYAVTSTFMDSVVVGFVSPVVAPVITIIAVTPPSVTLNVTDTKVFYATAKDQFGAPMPGINITWTRSNTTVGSVSPMYAITGADGNASTTFTALAAGTTMVNATNGTKVGTATVNVTKVLKGDVNGDGVVNSGDVTYLARYLAEWPGYITTTGRADVTGDGIVNSGDVTYLARYLAEWPGYTL